MSTHRSTWKKSEGRAASVFGTKRQPCSGSGGRADLTCSDSVHPTLFIESKLRERHAVRTLFDETKELAKRERKTPVLMLADKNRPGHLVVVHTDDLRAVVVEWVAAHMSDALEGEIRRAVLRNREELESDLTDDDGPRYCDQTTPEIPS